LQPRFTEILILVADPEGGFVAGEQAAQMDGGGKEDPADMGILVEDCFSRAHGVGPGINDPGRPDPFSFWLLSDG
jgi:hypothetical protein